MESKLVNDNDKSTLQKKIGRIERRSHSTTSFRHVDSLSLNTEFFIIESVCDFLSLLLMSFSYSLPRLHRRNFYCRKFSISHAKKKEKNLPSFLSCIFNQRSSWKASIKHAHDPSRRLCVDSSLFCSPSGDFPSNSQSEIFLSLFLSLAQHPPSESLFRCCCYARTMLAETKMLWYKTDVVRGGLCLWINQKCRKKYFFVLEGNSLECARGDVLVWQLDNGSRGRQWHDFSMSSVLLITFDSLLLLSHTHSFSSTRKRPFKDYLNNMKISMQKNV